MLPENMPVQAMTTFRVVQPPRPATCAEYGCPRYLNGWLTVVPEGPKAEQARSLRGRYRFTETVVDGGLVEFRFEPGQECWAQHRMPWDGRERLFQRAGDHRGNPTGWIREFTRGDDWVDAFASNQIAVAERAERG